MINQIVKWVIGKNIILYNPHRNLNPLLEGENKKKFIFIDPKYLIKATYIFGRDTKVRYYAIAAILQILNPSYILDINWIGKIHSLYYLWCSKNGKKFIVLQHGTYSGGIVNSNDHKYTKCHVFLVWSNYFKNYFETNNKGKDLDILVFGNPIYNKYDRSEFSYKSDIGNKILVAVSLVTDSRFEKINSFINELVNFGFDVTVKEHSYQSRKSESFTWGKKTSENQDDLYTLLKSQLFDIILTDISTAMNDIIFFKNRALFFSPDGEDDIYLNNIYSRFLKNAAVYKNDIKKKEDILQFIDIEAQEKLLNFLINPKRKENTLHLT